MFALLNPILYAYASGYTKNSAGLFFMFLPTFISFLRSWSRRNGISPSISSAFIGSSTPHGPILSPQLTASPIPHMNHDFPDPLNPFTIVIVSSTMSPRIRCFLSGTFILMNSCSVRSAELKSPALFTLLISSASSKSLSSTGISLAFILLVGGVTVSSSPSSFLILPLLHSYLGTFHSH